MADSGLTNGAFYAHFDSKDDLVATVVSEELAGQLAAFDALEPGRAGTEAFIREYLSPEHRDQRGSGCPSAALLDEIVRCEGQTREAYTHGVSEIVNAVAARLDPADRSAAQGRAIGLFTLLVGSLQLARAVTDPDLSDEVLRVALGNALRLLD